MRRVVVSLLAVAALLLVQVDRSSNHMILRLPTPPRVRPYFVHLAGVLLEAASCSATTVGGFTCVQSKATDNAASATPSIATTSNVLATSVVVGHFTWASATATLNSLTLSGAGCSGASSALYDNPATLVAWRSASFSLWGLAAGACTIQFNLSASLASIVAIHEIGGATNNADPVGTRHALSTQGAPGTATDAVTVGPVTASGTDYIFGATSDCNQASPMNAGTGYSPRESVAGSCRVTTEDKPASGANTVTFTDTNATQYNMTSILSIKAAVASSRRCGSLGLVGVGC